MAAKTVATFAELKAAVEDSDTTEITLSADMTFTSGIKIPTAKKTLTINGGGHTVTDMNSTAASSALYVSTGFGTADITVKNVVWSGRNYYGIVCVYDDTANSGVSVLLEMVTYNGPQAIYNRYGTTTVKNCNFTIEKNGSSASAQEFCEANRLIIAGNTTINCLSSGTAVMWFAFAGAELTVEADAVVNITAPNTYLIYSDTAAKPKLTFRHASTTTISVKNGLFYAAGTGAHIASSCTVERNAVLSVTSSANNGVPMLKCAGDFTLMQGGSLFLTQPQSGSSPLIYFSTASKVNFQSPKNVVLYSYGGKVFSFAAGATVTIAAERVNYWTKSVTPYTAAGGFDDIPATAIFKADGTDLSITQTLTASAVTATSSDLTDGDGGYPLSATDFDLTKATVLSMGNLPLTVTPVNDLSTAVYGTTDKGAAVQVVYGGQVYSSQSGTDGQYSVKTDEKFAVGSTVEVGANKHFLTVKKSVVATGSVSVTGLPDIPFNAIGTPRYSAPLERLAPDWQIELTDTRTNGGRWALYVAIENELQSDGNVIAGAVTFTDNETATVGSELTLVSEGQTSAPQKIYLSWDKTKGILLDIAQDTVYTGGKYVAKLKWIAEFD